MPIPTLTDEGHLPPGRYRATASEVYDVFVRPWPESNPRHDLWREWQDATGMLTDVVDVAMAWLSGSFLSPKAEPGDVDCVYVIPTPGIEALAGRGRRVFDLFAWNRLRAETGLRVDAFVLPWPLIPGVDRKPQDSVYHQDRGYWDDLWQRRRSGPKDSPPRPEDALPRRGYVEVVLDGAV